MTKSVPLAAALLLLALAARCVNPDPDRAVVTPMHSTDRPLSQREMQAIYDQVKTPYKYGVVLTGDGSPVDCPYVFRCNSKWFMAYICMNQVGYETMLAASDDLLHWTKLGTILRFRRTGWEAWQCGGGPVLHDPEWGGSCELQPFDGKYWMTYIGGALQGYETDPLSIGVAWTHRPDRPTEWRRFVGNPVLMIDQPDVRAFETATLYRSNVVRDSTGATGYPFVMFYNGKQKGEWVERIGMAVSRDMTTWLRYGDQPVIDNGKGISGDPQIVKIGDVWVMFYFGAFWQPKAFDTFACSRDLIHWTKWTGKHLIEPSEAWDAQFAHKPWVIKHDGVVYHYYCAVGSEGRVIALGTSKDLKGPLTGEMKGNASWR